MKCLWLSEAILFFPRYVWKYKHNDGDMEEEEKEEGRERGGEEE